MNSATNKTPQELESQRDLVRRPRKRIAAIAVAAGLAVSLAVPGAVVFAEGVGSTSTSTATEQSASSSTVGYKKNQVVYVKTDADGNRSGVYVVNSFEAAKGAKISDAGEYTKVTNLSTTKKLKDKNGAVAVTGQGVQDFVYQGDLNKNTDMPWNVTVSYQLDGKTVAAEELAGKSGKLTMKLKVEKNESYTGGDYADNYLVQITGSLKNSEAHEVEAEGATSAANGSNTQLTYMVIPGTTGDYTIKADVEDFEFDGWQILGVPLALSIEVDSSDISTGSMESVNDLKDGAVQLDDGASELASGASDLKDGADTLGEGVSSLQDGAGQLSDGVGTLVSSGAKLVEASGEVADGLAQLRDVAMQLNDAVAGMTDPGDGSVTALQTYAQTLSIGLATLDTKYDDLDQGIADYTAGVSQLKDGIATVSDGADQLADGATTLAQGAGDLKDGADELAEGTGELRTQTADIDDKIADGVTEGLSDYLNPDFEPRDFVSGEVGHVSRVQFVIKTAAIEEPEEAEEDETQDTAGEESRSFWDKLVALFKGTE